MVRILKRNMLFIAVVFSFIQILTIIWHQIVLGNHGFTDRVFSFFSCTSVFGVLVISVAAVGLNEFDEAYCKGIIKATFWNVMSYISCYYVIKRNTDAPLMLEGILFPLYVTTMTGLLILLKRWIREISIGSYLIVVLISLIAITFLFLVVKNPCIQTIGIFLFLTAIIYASLLLKQSDGLKYAGIILCVLFYTLLTGYYLGLFGKTVIVHNGEEYKVLMIDSNSLYCEGKTGSIIIPIIGEID